MKIVDPETVRVSGALLKSLGEFLVDSPIGPPVFAPELASLVEVVAKRPKNAIGKSLVIISHL
jgi:hypothetical protein